MLSTIIPPECWVLVLKYTITHRASIPLCKQYIIGDCYEFALHNVCFSSNTTRFLWLMMVSRCWSWSNYLLETQMHEVFSKRHGRAIVITYIAITSSCNMHRMFICCNNLVYVFSTLMCLTAMEENSQYNKRLCNEHNSIILVLFAAQRDHPLTFLIAFCSYCTLKIARASNGVW